MSRFSLYTLILMGVAASVVAVGEYKPQFTDSPNTDDQLVMEDMSTGQKFVMRRRLPDQNQADMVGPIACPALAVDHID